MTNTKSSEDLSYDIEVLKKMITQLPEGVRKPLHDQLEKILKTQQEISQKLLKIIKTDSEDIKLHIKAMIFDLEATRKERDNYKKQLDDKTK